MQYELRICKGICPDAIQVLNSSQPFMPVQRGDILNTRSWSSSNWNSVYEVTDECPNGVQLRVIGFEHQIIQMNDDAITRHIIMVYTQAIDDLEENRP